MTSRLRALSSGQSMGRRYIPLSNLDDNDQISPSPGASSIFSRVSTLPKRWLFLGAMTVICLLILLSVTHHSTTSSSASISPDLPPATVPLLGELEDATKLWYPASLQGLNGGPRLATYNVPPPPNSRPRTPLFIGFTRNNDMIIQAVLSYISAGWPSSDIIVVDNSGTMDSNSRGFLSPSNPFFLDYDTLRNRYGVNVLQTPTLLNFSQLQNFFLRTALAHGWLFYFWSHMDIAVLSDESATPYKSFYDRVLDILRDLGVEGTDMSTMHLSNDWALKYFTYDWLTLINVNAWRSIGQWDPFIPYYASDCDMYSRLAMQGFSKDDVRAGTIFDLASILPDPETRFFPTSDDEQPDSPRYRALRKDLEDMMANKTLGHRNEWQAGKGDGGMGQPWTYDPKGFQTMWWKTAEFGRELYGVKWGNSQCRLDENGFRMTDEFKKEHAASFGG